MIILFILRLVLDHFVQYELKNKESVVAIGRLATGSETEGIGGCCNTKGFGSAYCMMKIIEVKDPSFLFGDKTKKGGQHHLQVGEVVRWRKDAAFAQEYEKGYTIYH